MGLFDKKDAKKEENNISIEYSGKHYFHISNMMRSGHKMYCTLYLVGEGRSKFNIFNKDYDISIQTFIHIKEYPNLQNAYNECFKTDRSAIVKELKKDIIERIGRYLSKEGLSKSKLDELKDNKLEFNFTISTTESELTTVDFNDR